MLSPRRSSRWSPTWLRLWAADSAALLFSQFAAVVATSALAILLARHLGPRNWGLFSGFLGLSLGLSIFVEFGLTQWLLRELARLWVQQEPDSVSPATRRRAGRIVALLGALGSVIGVVGIVLSPRLVPIVFGSDYSHAVHTVQVMLVAIPFFFAANPLLAHVYTARLEHRRLGLGLGGVSFLGTGAVVAGQLLVGPVGAACGYVARAVLVLALLALASSASGFADRFLRGRQPARDHRFGEVPA